MMRHHRATDADVTIAAHRNAPEHIEKYGILQLSGASRVCGFQEKPPQTHAASNLASTGIYLFHPRVLNGLQDRPGQDIATDLLPAVLNSGGHIEAFDPHFCWTDIGTARDYFTALVRALKEENVGIPATESSKFGRPPRGHTAQPEHAGTVLHCAQCKNSGPR